MDSPTSSRCAICAGPDLRTFDEFPAFRRVTSDCKPFENGGELAECLSCGAVQKVRSGRWLEEIGRIYCDYAPYYQADGNEQLSIDFSGNLLVARSAILAERLMDAFRVPPRGRLLDIGCGNGATLRAFHEKRPEWDLEGHELSGDSSGQLSAIPKFRTLHTGEIGAIGSGYDLISLVHVLEHFVDPSLVLCDISKMLSGDGLLFIQVCNLEENPFDILIADHLMHFSPRTIERLLRDTGFEPVSIATDWVKKEISVVAKISREKHEPYCQPAAARGWAQVERTMTWLRCFSDTAANEASLNARFGVFGTSISGTWLASQLGQSVRCFVDEDQNRIGHTHLGKRVLSPTEVEAGTAIYLALTPAVARLLAPRLAGSSARWILPPNEPFLAQ